MAGRYGAERIIIRNLRVVRIDADHHLVLVEGAVSGPNGGLVLIRPTNKKNIARRAVVCVSSAETTPDPVARSARLSTSTHHRK